MDLWTSAAFLDCYEDDICEERRPVLRKGPSVDTLFPEPMVSLRGRDDALSSNLVTGMVLSSAWLVLSVIVTGEEALP